MKTVIFDGWCFGDKGIGRLAPRFVESVVIPADVVFSGELSPSDTYRLIGWSLGGFRAIEISARYPELVKELVLISTTSDFIAGDFERSSALRTLYRRFKDVESRNGALTAFYEQLLQDEVRSCHTDSKCLPHTAQFLEITRCLDQEGLLNGLNMLEGCIETEVLRSIKATTLIIHGSNDTLIPFSHAELIAESIPGSDLKKIEGAGHLLPFTDQELLYELIINNASNPAQR